jgi:predicted PurR-regulated permease PerM
MAETSSRRLSLHLPWPTPRVYGNRLRLSKLAVLLAFAVGAQLAGVVGALLELPLAALYPTN